MGQVTQDPRPARFVQRSEEDGGNILILNEEVPEDYTALLRPNTDLLRRRMADLQAAAERLGCDAPGFDVAKSFNVQVWRDPFQDGHYSWDGRTYLGVDYVKVWGTAPKYNGWSFVAKAETQAATDGGRVAVLSFPEGMEVDQAETARLRDNPESCDHCGHKRNRNKVFLVRHDDGRHVIVGSTCMKDFLGHRNPDQVMRLCDQLYDVSAFLSMLASMEKHDIQGSYDSSNVPMRDLLAAVHMDVRVRGQYWSKAASERYSMASGREHKSTPSEADGYLQEVWSNKTVADNVDKKFSDAEVQEAKAWLHYWEQGLQHADKVLDWALNTFQPMSDFDHDMASLARAGQVDIRFLGKACYLYEAHRKATEKAVEQAAIEEAAPLLKHIGEPKERLDLSLKVVRTRLFEGSYDRPYTKTLVAFVDAEGNQLEWWASGYRDEVWKVDETYQVRATVKQHKEFNGQPVTVLTRVAMVNNDEEE